MKCKIFTEFGAAGIEKIEHEVNKWLRIHTTESIKNMETTMCSISSGEEMYQCIVITIWYEPSAAG